MPLSPQEKADLDIAKAKVDKLKIECIDFQIGMFRGGIEGLKHSGHKTVEDALAWALKDTMREIDAIWVSHLKKYPD